MAYPINTQIATRHEALGEGTGMGIGSTNDPAFTLQSAHSHAVAYGIQGNIIDRQPHNGGNGLGSCEEQCPTLTKTDIHGVMSNMHVRRLTPRECERLQGFPDNYTLIPYRGKLSVDGPRYKALGNSMAVPVMRWLGERIDAVNHILS